MKTKRLSLALCSLITAALACTIGQVRTSQQLSPPPLVSSPVIQAQPVTMGPPTDTPAPAATDTPAAPQVSVNSATNCRTGPSTAFDWLWGMQPGMTAEVVGKNTPTGYWIIKYPGGQCWLWGQYATVTGNTASLVEYPLPATPTPSKPAAPTAFKASASCSPIPATLTFAVHVKLTWTDVATNEEGYRIYRNDSVLATLAANSTSFEDDTTLPVAPAVWPPVPGPTIKYGIEAFNGDETSALKEREVNCD